MIRQLVQFTLVAIVVVATWPSLTGTVRAQPSIYSQNFDANDSNNWHVNDNGIGDNAANFFFDYSTVGIPPAPRSAGTTRGLKLGANLNDGSGGNELDPAISVSPMGRSFTGD